MAKAKIDNMHYTRAGQVRRALNELENARAHGNGEREKAALKELDSLGYQTPTKESASTKEESHPTVTRETPPVDRTAPADRVKRT
jgi:hypothetical protein